MAELYDSPVYLAGKKPLIRQSYWGKRQFDVAWNEINIAISMDEFFRSRK